MDFEYIKPLLADGSGDGDGEYTSAERRADVASQFRDKYGRWVEMGRGIKGKVRLGKRRGADAGRTARIVGKFINATPDGKYARVLVDPSDPLFGGKIVYIRNNNAEEILATLDPEYLKKRGIELGKNTEGFEVGDEGIQDEDTLTIEEPTSQDLEDSKADLPDPGDYKQEASTLIQSAVAGKDLAVGNIVYDQGSDQYGKITQVRTLADGTKQIFVQFQNGRRAILNVPADHPIQAWIGKDEAKPTPEAAPTQNREGSSIADLGIDLQTATMDANGARLPTPGAFTGAFQRIVGGAKNWADVAKRLFNQTVTYFDFETTGISDYDGQGIKNDPIQLGAVKVKNGKIIGRFNVYMNPGSKLSTFSADHLKRDVVDENGNVVLNENGKPQSTPITPEWLTEQMSPTEALKLFLEFIGPKALLGGQNVPFDLEILQRMADDAGVKLDIAGTIDSKDLASLLPTYDPEKGIDGPKQIADKETGRMRPSSSLGPVANFLGFEPANWHSADGDAEDSYNLVRAIIDRAANENNPDMRLLDFPEMQRLYKERMAAFKNSISENNPVTEAQLAALNEFAGSDNQEIAAEAKKAINEATTRGKAAEVLARLNTNKDRTNNTPNQFRIGGGGGGELGEGNGIPNKKELEFLNRLGYFLKKKFTKKPKQYIPVGYDRIDNWGMYPQWYKDVFESAGNLDDFVKLFWKALRETRKGTDLEDPEGRTDINEREYAIAAAAYKNLQGIGKKVILRYGGFTVEFDKESDINGQLLDELKNYLRTARELGLKLPVRIKIAKQGDPAFTEGEVIGFDKDHPELGFLTGEAHTEDDGTMHLILWDQLHNMDKTDLRRLFKGVDENGQEDYYWQNPGGFVSALQHVFFHELGHLWNREKHGKMVNSPVWGELKKMFWGTDSKPFKRFSVTPNADKDFDERMAELFAAAIIAFHDKEDRVLPNIGQFWKVAIEPYIDAEPLHWTANSERVNPPKKEEKGKGKKATTEETRAPRGGGPKSPDVKKPEDVKPGDILYDKDGNLHGKVVVIRQDRHGNWHYWVEGKDYKPGDVFPVGLDEYTIHKNGVAFVTDAGANFVPDEGPDFIENIPKKLDSSNSDAVKAEDLKPGMVYEGPDGPVNIVNVIEHGIDAPNVKRSRERLVVYVDLNGEIKHEVVPVGTFKKVLTSSKSNVPAPAPENEGGEGNGNGGGRGGRGGNAPEPVSEEPEKPVEETVEPEITTDDPIGKGKIDPKGYGTNEGYVRMTHPKPDFPAETDEKKLIEKGFEIEEQDNRGNEPSQNREEDGEEGEEGEEGAQPYEDPSKFAVGKKTTVIWHNKDFSSPGARIKITYTRKADGSLDERYTEIQWVRWDGSIGGDGYGPGEVLDFALGQDEKETFRIAFEFATKALARRNEEYNNNELPGQFPHPFRKVGEDHIWRVVKDAKTGKLKAGRDTKRDMEKKPPFGAIISNKDGKWTANVLDAKGNTVATFEVDGDANDQSALENIMNQAYAELAKKYREINSPRPTPAARPATPAARPAGKAADEHDFPLPDDVEMFKIRDGKLTEYGINMQSGVDFFGQTSAGLRGGVRFGANIHYVESKGHWIVSLLDSNSSLDRERGIEHLNTSERYKVIKGDISDPKVWEEAVKEARKFVADAIARNGGNNTPYGYEHRSIESLDDIRVDDYIMFRTSYPPSINHSDTDYPAENISGFIGKVLSIGKDKEGNRTFKIKLKNGSIKNLTDKQLDYVGGAVRFSDDDPTIAVSTVEVVRKRLAEREMRELRYFIGMDIDKDPNKSEDSLEKIYKAVEDKIGSDLIEDHRFVQSLQKALSKKMYDKSNTKGYLTEEEIYKVVDKAIENYSAEKKPTTEPTTSPTGLKGEHSHPLPDDVEMFPAGPKDLYAKYVINGEGFQHEVDFPDVGLKDGLRFGAEIYYQEEIAPNSYDKKGRPAGWKIHLLDKNWNEDYARDRTIEYRNSVVPGDINDPEVWKKAVEEARRMVASAIAEKGGENVPYTSEYIALESLDQIQSGDYLMYGGHFPPTIKWKGTKSEETSPNFYAQVISVGKDADGNRIFEIKQPNFAQGGYYDNVFLNDEEFSNRFGGITGLARYSDENPNVKPAAEPVAETQVEEEEQPAEELTEEERQANIDAWTEVGQLYRKYIAAKRGTNKKREAKRLKQELSPFPVVMLHEKLTDYRDILDNTRSASTDENERKALSKRSAEITDAMKQLNVLTNKGMKEGVGKPTDPLDFNFDDLFREIEIKDGISESDVEEVVNEPEVVEEPAAVEEPVKNVIETAGGVLDFDGLSPMQLGKINKHLDSKVVWEGEVMTYRELYKRFAIGKRKFQVRKDTNYVDGKPIYTWGPIEYRLFIDENRGTVKVPKMIYDAFKPTSSDPSLNEDRTSEVIEAEWAKEEAERAATTTTPAVSTPPVKPEEPATAPTVVETPKDLGPVQITKDTAKQYLAEKIDVGWTIYGPDGYALGIVTKKDVLGRVIQLTVRGPNGKETTYNFNSLTKLNAFSPKDKKDIEKAEKAKAKEPKPAEEPKPTEQPQEEAPDKISREDGFRLFEAVKKVYDYLHRVKRTEDPDAAKKDANDKVNQLAKILNPEDVDDFIRYVDLETAFKNIRSTKDLLDNFEEYLNNYSAGKGAEVNPIHRGADGKIINKGDDLIVVDSSGNLKKIKLQIFKKPNPRALSDKTDFIEWGYMLEGRNSGDPRIVNINDSKESYSLDNVFHNQNESEVMAFINGGRKSEATPATPAKPEVVEEAKPAAGAEYNKDLENDLAVFKNALEDMVENFRNQPGSDKNVYKAAAKELYNELKKLNSLHEDSATSGDALEQIRNVYDDKIRDLGDIQSAKEKSNPNQNRENFVKDLRNLQDALIDDFEAERDLGIMGTYSPYNVLSYSDEDKAILLKKATAARLLKYMPDVSFVDLFNAVVNTPSKSSFPFTSNNGTVDINSTIYNEGYSSNWAYDRTNNIHPDGSKMESILGTDMSNLVEGSQILAASNRYSSDISEIVILTITQKLLDRVKNDRGSDSSSNILDFIENEMNARPFSSSSSQDMSDLKEILIANMVRLWAITSNDSSLKSHALQRTAARLFAMDTNKTAGWKHTNGLHQSWIDDRIQSGDLPADVNTMDKLEQYSSDLVDKEMNANFNVYSKFVMGMYNSTQDLLKDRGIDGVVVYRGSQEQELIAPDGTPIKRNTRVLNLMSARAKQRPMSSWATSIRTASNFAGGLAPIIMGKIVPAEKVIAMPGTGFGCFEENEIVLLGGDLDEVLYGVPGNINLDAFKNSIAMNPTKQIQALDPSTGFVGILPPKPTYPTSQNREGNLPIIGVDDSEESSDWIKQNSWDLPKDVDNFLNMFPTREDLSKFMSTPAASGMPTEMAREIWPAADEHFKKIESAPKEEESKYLPEPFDPRDKKIDLDEYYNYDYTKMPDGTPFNSEQQRQMDAVSRKIDEVLKANNGDATSFAVQNLKNFRRTHYQQIIAKPNENSSTTRESILDQVEFSDKPAVKYFDEASGKNYTRYVDKFTDKYGRKYYIVTNIDESSGRQTVIAYDEKNFEGMPLPEDYVRKDQPVSGISDVGGLDSYVYRDPSQSEIQSVMVNINYQRRGLATAMLAVLEKRLGLPVVHSDNLSSMGFAFSNSVDPGKPDLHTNEKSIELQSDNAPSQNREGFFKKNKTKKEPFDPSDPTIDLEKHYNYDYTKLPDGTPFNVYQQQQMDILKDAIDNEPDTLERRLRIAERRRIYQGFISKPNLKSSTNLETIKNQVGLLDDNTSRMNYSGAGKPYANLSPDYKQSTQYIDEFTDKYGRQYWAVTKVVNGLGMSNVKLYDKSKNSLQDLQDNSEDRTPVSMLDVFNNKISMVHTSDRYLRRGLATAALYLARKRSGKEVQHSEMLTTFGKAFSLSVDPNPDLHRNDESKAALANKDSKPSQNREGQYLPEPFDPNDRTIDMDTIYNYDYTKLPDGTPFNAKQQKAMDHENKLLEEAIASGDESKINAAKVSRRHTYNTFITVANPDSKTNTTSIADQITLGKSKPKKFTGFVRYTDNFIDKYGRKYVIFTDISTNDSSDKAAIVTVHDLEGQFLKPLYTPEGMENVDTFGGKFLHIASLNVDDSDRKDLNGSAYIGLVMTNDAYRRRGLATAMLYLARKHYKKPVNHSSTLTSYGRAFSNSVDAGNPDAHDSLESKQLQIDLLKQRGLPVEEPELDGDEIDYGPNQNREGAEEPAITNQYLEVIPLINSYRDKNDPNLDITEWVTGDTNIYGIGNGGNPLGYVRTEKLATMKGNLADMESSTSSIAHDLEDGTGYLEPVLVWYNPLTGRSFIAEGNHRVAAARIAGREYVPVIVGVSTVDFKNPTTMEKEGGVGDTVLNKDGSLENFKNVKDGSLINPYHLFNDEDLLYPRINLDPNDVPGFTDVLKIQSDLLDNRMSENQETGINDIAKWYDPNAFDVDSSIGFMGGTSEQLKEITAKNIGRDMLSSPKDILGALDHAISISQVVRSRLSYLDSQKMALKALDTKSDNLNGNSIVLFVDDSEHSPYEGLHLETLREVLQSMDPYDEELYGNPYDEKTIDYKTLFEDYYENENKKPIFFDNPDDVEAFKEKAASIFVAQWAETSNGSDLVSHALQIAAAEAFNMPAGSWAPWKAQGKNAQTTKDIIENAEYYYGIHSSVLKDFLRTMYSNTQQEFKDRGIKHLLVYRGTGVDEEAVRIDTGIEYNGIGDAEIIQRPMSAWAWLYGDAFNFATSRLQYRAGMFMGTIVPVEQVLSIPGTGFGCFEEAEVVLLGGKNRLVRAVTSDSSDDALTQKTFIDTNKGQVISYLLDQLPKDKDAFDNLIEFNSSTPNAAGPSQNREGASINVDDSIENSDWVISEFAKKKKLNAKESGLSDVSGQAKPAEEPLSLNELHRTFITSLLAGSGDLRTRPIPGINPEWLAADVETDKLSNADKLAIHMWYMDVVMNGSASSSNLSPEAADYLVKHIVPLIDRHKEEHMLLPNHDIYVNKDNNVTIKVVRFITNPTKKNGRTNVNTEYRAATADGVAKFANKLSDILSRVTFKFPVKELQVIITHPNIEDFFKPFTRDDGTFGRNLAGMSFPHMFVNGQILNEEGDKPNPKLTENPRSDATELESTIAHEIGHILQQKGIINFNDQATKDTLRRFMTEYPLSDYAATDEAEYLAEAYAGMMISEDGIGRHKEVADWINDQIATVDERKEKAAIDLLKGMLDKLGIPNNSKPSQNREGSKEQIIASAAKDIASSGVGFIPGSLKLKGSIATDGPDVGISGSPKDRAKAPSDQATALKNEMISLGHTVLDDAIALSDEQAKAEGLIPEGFTAEEYRKKLENDSKTIETEILRGDRKFKAMSQDLMRNAFNRLSYEDKEEVFQSFKEENARKSILSGKDKNTFEAEETFNMLLVEYGEDLAHKLAYDYSTPYPEFLFDTGKTVLMRQRAEFTNRLTKKVKEEKTLVDVTWAHEGPDTILSMLTKWAIQTGKIDMSEFTKKAAEIKDFRDRLNSLPKAEDFIDKYHSIIGKNIKSQLENTGVEFDSIPVQDFFKQYKNYKLINTNDHFQDIRWDNNRKLIKNLEDTLSLIPKDIILAGMDYLKQTGGMLGVQVSDARAHFVQHWLHGRQIVNMIRKNGQQSDGGYFRGDSADDYLHEVWHFFQMINPDISTMEHAFTYDRVKEANSPDIFPIMELYETSVEKSFSGAKVANPYTVKQYRRMTSKMSSFSPLNHSAEVITTTMQDLFTSPGRFSVPHGVTVKTGTGKKTTLFSDAHIDIATGIWYTDATMTTKIDPALITGIEGLDVSNDTDWDLKAFGIGLLLSLLNWENK